jgi:hypothetical protein
MYAQVPTEIFFFPMFASCQSGSIFPTPASFHTGESSARPC